MQMLVYGLFILGINLKNLLNYSIEKMIQFGILLTVLFFSLGLGILIYLPQHLFWVIVNVLLFCLSTGFIFFSLNRKAIEIPKGAPMGTIIAVFSMAMNLFGFLGSLAARKLYF